MKELSQQRKEREGKNMSRQWKGKISPRIDPAITLDLCSFNVHGQTDGRSFDSLGVGVGGAAEFCGL